MWFKIVHLFCTVLFALIDYPRKHYEQLGLVNYLAFLRFLLCMIFIMLIQINETVFEGKTSSFAQEYMKISRYLLGIFAAYFAFNLLFYLPDYSIVLLVLGFYGFVVAVFIFFEGKTRKNGVNETIYSFIFVPLVLFTSQIVMFSDYDLESFLCFAPCNSVFFILCITYTSQTSLNEYYEKNLLFSISRLLGKQDSFRIIILLLGYCYFALILETFQKKTLL